MAEAPPPWSAHGAGVTVAESAISVCVLRLRALDDALGQALGEAFALSWPTTPNTVAEGRFRIAWLGPGEWALFAPAEQIAERISAACGDRLHHLADVSAGRRVWRIEGSHAARLLAKDCSLDTHPSVLGAGRCAQSLLTQVNMLLVPIDGDRAFDLVADASHAAHLRAWFADAILEFQS